MKGEFELLSHEKSSALMPVSSLSCPPTIDEKIEAIQGRPHHSERAAVFTPYHLTPGNSKRRGKIQMLLKYAGRMLGCIPSLPSFIFLLQSNSCVIKNRLRRKVPFLRGSSFADHGLLRGSHHRIA